MNERVILGFATALAMVAAVACAIAMAGDNGLLVLVVAVYVIGVLISTISPSSGAVSTSATVGGAMMLIAILASDNLVLAVPGVVAVFVCAELVNVLDLGDRLNDTERTDWFGRVREAAPGLAVGSIAVVAVAVFALTETSGFVALTVLGTAIVVSVGVSIVLRRRPAGA